MNLKVYIKNYVDNNYTLSLGEKEFKVFDKNLNRNMEVSDLTKDVFMIFFGDSNNDDGKNLSAVFDITNSFFKDNRKKLLASFYEGIDKFDYNKKSMDLIEDLIDVLDKCGLSEDFITPHSFLFKLFDEYYYEKYVDSGKLDTIKNSIHVEYHNSSHVESIVNSDCDNETGGVTKLISDEIKKYYIGRFNDKVKTFLERTSVKLGETNWHLENLDYGKIEVDKVESIFQNETNDVLDKFRKAFDLWYHSEVIKASEKIMGIC